MSQPIKEIESIDSISHSNEARRGVVAAREDEKGTLYYGDNLAVLHEYIDDQSVDLVYLDPPFNSNAQYNVIFERSDGNGAEAQAGAFHDTWTWTAEESEVAYESVMKRGDRAAATLSGIMSFLGKTNIMAYLCMMTIRMIELKRVLKPTGSTFLHCDPTASHYLKLLLDAVYGPENFRNEIVWQRTSAHNDASQGLTRFGRVHDSILFFSKATKPKWNVVFAPYSDSYLKQHYANVEPRSGRRFKTSDLTAAKPGGDTSYVWKSARPPAGRYWAYSKEKMTNFEKEGRLVYAAKSGMPRLKHYLDEMPGVALGDVWTDIPPVNSQAAERLGYPTQKPLPLLERIIAATTAPGDVVLDPFCGCGTTIEAAQKLGRQWIGIDVTHYAITVIEERLKKQCGGLLPSVVGRPEDMDAAWDLARRNKYQFQWWANWLVGVQNYREHQTGGDRGIDGKIFFMNGPYGTGRILVSVKAGDTLNPAMVRDLVGTVDSEKAELGLFVCIATPTAGMLSAAARAGLVKTAHGSFPKIQIVTVEDLLSGKKPNLPPYYQATGDMYRAKRAPQTSEPQLSFKFPIAGGNKRKRRAEEIIYPSASLLLAR